MFWDIVSTHSLVGVFSVAPQCNLWFYSEYLRVAGMKSGYACFLLQNLMVVFAVRRVYLLTAYTGLVLSGLVRKAVRLCLSFFLQ